MQDMDYCAPANWITINTFITGTHARKPVVFVIDYIGHSELGPCRFTLDSAIDEALGDTYLRVYAIAAYHPCLTLYIAGHAKGLLSFGIECVVMFLNSDLSFVGAIDFPCRGNQREETLITQRSVLRQIESFRKLSHDPDLEREKRARSHLAEMILARFTGDTAPRLSEKDKMDPAKSNEADSVEEIVYDLNNETYRTLRALRPDSYGILPDIVEGNIHGVPVSLLNLLLSFTIRAQQRSGTSFIPPDTLSRNVRAICTTPIYNVNEGCFHFFSRDPEWRNPTNLYKLGYNFRVLGLLMDYDLACGESSYLPLIEDTLDCLIGMSYDTHEAMFNSDRSSFKACNFSPLQKTDRERDSFSDDWRILEKYLDLSAMQTGGSQTRPQLLEPMAAVQDFRSMRKTLHKILGCCETLPPRHGSNVHSVISNTLGCSILSYASILLEKQEYCHIAEAIAERVWDSYRVTGRVPVCLTAGNGSQGNDELASYAYFVQSMLDLYTCSINPIYLDRAREVHHAMRERFWDREQNAYSLSPMLDRLIGRRVYRSITGDSSGMAIALRNDVRLAEIADKEVTGILVGTFEHHWRGVEAMGQTEEFTCFLDFFNWAITTRAHIDVCCVLEPEDKARLARFVCHFPSSIRPSLSLSGGGCTDNERAKSIATPNGIYYSLKDNDIKSYTMVELVENEAYRQPTSKCHEFVGN